MKRTIVIVDDEPITRMDTREILEANGYDVVGEASDGFEAIEVCKKYNIGITVTVFRQSAEEIEKIVEVCKKYNIEITGSVFMKGAEEIEKIIEVLL